MRQEIIVCDKCKEEFPAGTEVNFLPNDLTLSLDGFDLCGNCVNLLYKWLKGEPIPKQTTT